MSYSRNTVTITQNRSQDNQQSNDLTATLRAAAVGLKVYNINLVNTRGKGSQALAVSAQADKQGYYACKFVGYQDTILANEGNQVRICSSQDPPRTIQYLICFHPGLPPLIH